MFEARLVQSAVFKKMLEAIKELLTEAVFECDESGIRLQAMDSSHVSLVSLKLRSDGFDNFQCDRNMALGINLASITKIMKCSSNDDVLVIKANNDPDHIKIIFESKHYKISNYELRLMNLDQEHLEIPGTEYSCVIKMPANEFSRICRDLSQFGETIVISCTKEGVSFSVTGDSGSANIKLAHSNEERDDAVNIEMNDPVSLQFAIRYLNLFAKATPLSNSVTLSLAASVPLLVEYRIGDIGHINYYLAPKLDDEES